MALRPTLRTVTYIAFAIKQAAASIDRKSTIVPGVRIYGFDGKVIRVKVVCELCCESRYCTIRFTSVDDFAIRNGTSSDAKEVRHLVRSRCNFLTGLDMHRESLHEPPCASEMSRSPLRGCLHFDTNNQSDEDLWSLLM